MDNTLEYQSRDREIDPPPTSPAFWMRLLTEVPFLYDLVVGGTFKPEFTHSLTNSNIVSRSCFCSVRCYDAE